MTFSSCALRELGRASATNVNKFTNFEYASLFSSHITGKELETARQQPNLSTSIRFPHSARANPLNTIAKPIADMRTKRMAKNGPGPGPG